MSGLGFFGFGGGFGVLLFCGVWCLIVVGCGGWVVWVVGVFGVLGFL